MNAELHLHYTPDLAEAVDAARSDGAALDARPVPLASLPAAVAAGRAGQVCLISAAALGAEARRSARVVRQLARLAASRRRWPVAVVLVGDEPSLAPWQRWATAHTTEPFAAGAFVALLRQALENARLRAELAATRRAVR